MQLHAGWPWSGRDSAAVLGPGAEVVVEQQTNFREMWADNPALYLDVHYTYLRLFNSIEERIRNAYNGVENTVYKDIYCLHLHICLLLWMRILSNHEDPIKVHWLSKTVGYFLRLYYLISTFNIYRGYFQKHNLTHKPLTDLECLHTEAGGATCSSTSSRASG